MFDSIKLNVSLLRGRVPNLTVAAREVGLRPATVSNLCTGKIPVGRAEVRTLVALASLAGCTLDELIVRQDAGEMVETGIKVIDLFAPLVRGGTVGFIAREGVGQFVLMAELVHRLKSKGFFTLFWTSLTEDPNLQDIIAETDTICGTADQVYDCVSVHSRERDVFLVADRETILSGELLDIQERFQSLSGNPLTVALVDTHGEAADEDSPFGPLESLLRFDTDLAVRRLYPAIDPVISTSILHEDAQLDSTHLKTQQLARKVLRHYRELRPLVNLRGLQGIAEKDVPIYRRGERLEAFMTQLFYVAEQFTNRPGTWVSLHETMDGVRRVLNGEFDHAPIEDLMYTGCLTTEQE